VSDLYREIAAGFDDAAELYDLETRSSPAMSYMRRVSLRELLQSFAPGQHVLELGCGTGEEAVTLARQGIHVLATDVSAQMLELTRAKTEAAGLAQNVQTRQLAAGEIGVLVEELGEGAFDGAFSSFGALNGEPDLRLVGRSLARLTRRGALVVASVMNRFYLFEVAWYLAHGRPREAVRRWGGRAMAPVSPDLPLSVPTWYHTPRAFARAFAGFRKTHCRALTMFLPPPYAAHVWKRFPGVVERLATWEERLSPLWPFAGLGDHFLITLKRT
jgi:ubiquinone/menaquinone biosynthesis C-methylase UbiE